MAKLFISHSHRNKPIARQIFKYLKDNSENVWLDENEILVGDSIPSKIQEGLSSSDFVLVLLSSDSVKSGWVQREVESKLSHEISTGEIHVLSVLCEKPDSTWAIPLLLATKKYADITDDFESGMDEILKAIRGHTHSFTQPKSTAQYASYLLGFTIAKIAWFYGNPIQLLGLKAQYKNFTTRLSIELELSEKILGSFKPVSDLGDVLKNAGIGIEARNTLAPVIMTKFGEQPAAIFRFGFNLINIMPQLEFVEAAQEKGSPETPPEQLLGPMEEQFKNLLTDGEILQLPDKYLSILRKAYSRASKGKSAEVRSDLIEIGSAIERDKKV